MLNKKSLRYISFFVILITTGTFLQAQPDSKIDSLLSLLEKSKEDTSKINLLNVLSAHLGHSNKMDEAIQYANQSLILSKKLKFKRGEATSYYNLGLQARNQANYTNALKNFFLSLNI